ncbi:hypothetical protein AVEN_51689-1, partial [Araneus ventricosus]
MRDLYLPPDDAATTTETLDVTEDKVRRDVRSDGKGKLSRRRIQLPLAPVKGKFQISMSSNCTH